MSYEEILEIIEEMEEEQGFPFSSEEFIELVASYEDNSNED